MVKLLAITGGSGSGKSTLARLLTETLGGVRVFLLSEDRYYYDMSHLDAAAAAEVNFDEPGAKDLARLEDDLRGILRGETVQLPDYCFKTRAVVPYADRVPACDLVILEGLHALARPGVRDLMHGSIFLDVPEEVRLCRRLIRDVQFRGRTVESVLSQYLAGVAEMHRRHVAPLKELSEYVVVSRAAVSVVELDPQAHHFDPDFRELTAYVRAVLER